MNACWHRWLPPALAAAVFALLSLALLPWPGLQHDEVAFTYPMYANGTASFSAHLFGYTIPLMDVSYYGALKTWIYLPILSLAAPSRWSVRLPMVILGIVTVWLTWEWIRRIAGPRAAAFTVALLATDSIFILTNTFDWGPVAIQHVLLVGGLLALQVWREHGDQRWLALAFFLWGLGLWDKALMIWPLIALTVAAVCVYPCEIRRLLSLKAAAIATLALLPAALPLVWYNIAHRGETATSNAHVSLASLPRNFGVLRSVFEGHTLFGVIAAGTPGPIHRSPPALIDALGSHPTRPYLFALALAVIAWIFLIRRLEGRILTFLAIASAAIWLQMAVNTGTGGSAHHVILMWPFACAFIGIALAGASAHVPRPAAWAIAALVAWFTIANLLNTATYLAALIRNGSPPAWTDADERLAGAISHYRDDPIVTVDWGYINGLRMYYAGQLHLIPITGETPERVAAIITQPNAILIQHTDNNQIFAGVNNDLRATAARLGYAEETLRVVHDDEGRAIFEILRLTKAR